MLIGVSTTTAWLCAPPAGPDRYEKSRAETSMAASSFGGIDQPFGDAPQREAFFAVALLPIGKMVGAPDLNRGHLVFRTIRRPVGVIRRHDVGPGHGVMEGRIDDAWLHAVADLGVQRNLAGAALERDEIAVDNAAALRVERMDLEQVLLVPDVIRRPPRLCADIVLGQDAAGGQQQRITRAC